MCWAVLSCFSFLMLVNVLGFCISIMWPVWLGSPGQGYSSEYRLALVLALITGSWNTVGEDRYVVLCGSNNLNPIPGSLFYILTWTFWCMILKEALSYCWHVLAPWATQRTGEKSLPQQQLYQPLPFTSCSFERFCNQMGGCFELVIWSFSFIWVFVFMPIIWDFFGGKNMHLSYKELEWKFWNLEHIY